MTIRAMLVDDEEPARDRLRGMLERHRDVQIVAEAEDGLQALETIARLRPDLVFLDIQMPGRSGLEVLASLEPPRPQVIFCTAFDQYAIDAFEHHALDYLLKPLNGERLDRAVDRARQTVAERERSRRELAEASEVQARMQPRELPQLRHLDYAGACQPARSVGGDYYDFVAVGPGRLGIGVGDVSGKGVYAGLLVAALQARVQALGPRYTERVAALVHEVNRSVYASTESRRYATMFYGVFDDATLQLTYVNAGHPPPLVFRREGNALNLHRRLESGGTVIGILEGARYTQQALRLQPGDLVVAFSDGVSETADAGGAELGQPGLVELVRQAPDASSALELRDRILAELGRRRAARSPEDDTTLVVARVRR